MVWGGNRTKGVLLIQFHNSTKGVSYCSKTHGVGLPRPPLPDRLHHRAPRRRF